MKYLDVVVVESGGSLRVHRCIILITDAFILTFKVMIVDESVELKAAEFKPDPLPVPALDIDSAGRVVAWNKWAQHWIKSPLLFDDLFRNPHWTFQSLRRQLQNSIEHRFLFLPVVMCQPNADIKSSDKFLCSLIWNKSTDHIICIFTPHIANLVASIRELGKSVVLKWSFIDLLGTATKHARLLTNADRAYIKIYDKELDLLRFEALSSNDPADRFSEKTTSPTRGMTGHVFTTKKSYKSGDVRLETGFHSNTVFPTTVSKLVVPLLATDDTECHGVLAVDSKQPHFFTDDTEELLVAFSRSVSIAIGQLHKYEELSKTFHHIIKEQTKQRNTMTFAFLHDAKNMVRSVVYQLQEIQQDLSMTNLQKRKAQELLQRIHKLDNIKDMMGSMLDEMKQADDESYDEDRKEIDLVTLSKNAVGVMPPADLAIDITVNSATETCLVYGTHRQLLPILYNLVINAVNAIKESGRPGKIAITLGETPQKSGFKRIQIADTGPGLPKQVLAFIRKGESYSGIPGGTGLGLITVRATVDSLGGAIDVSSKVGEGTTFTLDLKGPVQ